ncbi:hypothetical protein VTJ04DRAFT_2470 [Mycothermus thermophilus]|uniref:uncharacterized protein n=1 Tax=Humicola insolens TaxID=85995 RepID=UPI0037434F10
MCLTTWKSKDTITSEIWQVNGETTSPLCPVDHVYLTTTTKWKVEQCLRTESKSSSISHYYVHHKIHPFILAPPHYQQNLLSLFIPTLFGKDGRMREKNKNQNTNRTTKHSTSPTPPHLHSIPSYLST